MAILSSILGSVISGLLTNVIKMFAEFFIVKQLGEDQQVVATQKVMNAQIIQDVQTRNAVRPITASELQNIKPGTDLDFRD